MPINIPDDDLEPIETLNISDDDLEPIGGVRRPKPGDPNYTAVSAGQDILSGGVQVGQEALQGIQENAPTVNIPPLITPDIISNLGIATADVAEGLVQGPLAVGIGASKFIGGMVAAPVTAAIKDPKGFFTTSPVNTMANIKDEADKFMEAPLIPGQDPYHPSSMSGQFIVEQAAKPFIAAHSGLMQSARDKAWVKSLTETEKTDLSVNGPQSAVHGTKEAWQEANPDAGVKQGKAMQLVFDIALLGVPAAMRGLTKRYGTGMPKTEIKSVVAEAKKTPDLTPDVLTELETHMKNHEIKGEPNAKAEGNQAIVDTLKVEAETAKTPYRKGADKRAAKIIEELKGDISEISLTEAGIKGKTRKRIKELIEERENNLTKDLEPLEESQPPVSPEKPPGKETALEPQTQPELVESPRAPVEQGKFYADPDLEFYNPEQASQIVQEFKEAGPTKVNIPDIQRPMDLPPLPSELAAQARALEGDLRAVGKGKEGLKIALEDGLDVKVRSRFTNLESVNKAAIKRSQSKGIETEVVKIGDKYAVADVVDRPGEGGTFATIDGAEVQHTLGRKITPENLEVAKDNARLSPNEYGNVIKVGEDYYHAFDKTVETVKAQEAIMKKVPSVRKDRYVENINKAKPEVVEDVAPVESKPVPPKDVKVADPYLTEFDTREAALDYAADNLLDGEIKLDPVTKKWAVDKVERRVEDIDPSMHEFGSEDVYDFDSASRENYGKLELDLETPEGGRARSLFDILDSERGSAPIGDRVDLQRYINTVQSVVNAAKRSKKSLGEYLDSIDVSANLKAAILEAEGKLDEKRAELAAIDPIGESILNPTEAIGSYGKIKKTKNGFVKEVDLTESFVDAAFGSNKKMQWNNTRMGNYQKAFETRFNFFRKYGPKMVDVFYDWIQKAHEAKLEHRGFVKQMQGLRKGLTRKERREIAIATAADQKGGVEALAAAGITEVPVMSPKQLTVIKQLRDISDSFFERINYVRSNTGVKPIPKMENHLPFIRNMNALRKLGIVDGVTTSTLGRVGQLSKEFTGVANPFAKKRSKARIAIELDVFKALDKYSSYALKEIHVAPIAAKAKAISNRKIVTETGVSSKGKKLTKSRYLSKSRPELAEGLNSWADEILGVDTLDSALAKRHPFIYNSSRALGKNIASYLILGTISTALKQFSALTLTAAETGWTNTAYGISRVMLEKPIRFGASRAAKQSKLLDLRRADMIMTEMVEAIELGQVEGLKKWATHIGALPMNLFDMLTAEASWYAAEANARRKGLKGEEAIKAADLAVLKTNAMGVKGATSPAQNMAGWKWLTVLQTFAISDYNYVAREVLGIKNPEANPKATIAKGIRYVAAATMANELYDFMGIDAPNPAPITAYMESKEKGDSEALATATALMEFFEKFPMIGGAVKYSSSLGGVVAEALTEMPEAAKALIEASDWGNMTDAEKKKTGIILASMLGKLRGTPFLNQLLKSIRTSGSGGTGWETVVGTYIDENRKTQARGGSIEGLL